MHLIGILLFLIQLGLIVHAVRNRADQTWLYALLFLPGIGGAAYFLTQVLPELMGSRQAEAARDTLLQALDPQTELRRRRQALETADTVANRIELADECVDAGFLDEAVELYESAREGAIGENPGLEVKLAEALFRRRDYAATQRVLDELIAARPDFRSTDAHLIYARSLVGQGQHERATEEYEALVQSHPGEEARVRFGVLLLEMGQRTRAQALFDEAAKRGRNSPRHYREREAEWLRAAELGGEGVETP